MLDTFTFPDHNIDPREKGFDWILQFCKAAWSAGSGNSFSAFYTNAVRYKEIRDYALGKQNITKYAKLQYPERIQDNTYNDRDATVVPVIPQFRNKSISKLLQREYEISAFAVDEQAKTDQDKKINEMRVKLAIREALEQNNSPLLQSPAIKRKIGDPIDDEQLDMMLHFGWKHNICMDAEMIIEWLFNLNNLKRERKDVVQDQYDFGAGGYKVYMDENGKPRFRAVNLENLVVSYCEQPDFSDASFIGEAIYVNVSDLVPYFTKAQIKDICDSVAGKYNNPQTIDLSVLRYYNKFKVLICDLQFISYNTTVYEDAVDKFGNPRFSKTEFDNLSKQPKGEADPKYISQTKKVIYEGKWVIGTDYMYDYGLAKNQVRKLSSWWDTQYDYVLESWNFDKMQFSGITEGLIPLADDYYETKMKLQNIKRKLIPYMIEIDLDGLENLNYGAGGQKFTPEKIIDLLFQSHILIYRGKELVTTNGERVNKPATIETTGMVEELMSLRNELIAIKQEMMEMSGYNAASFGTPNPKLLNAGYDAANSATNDSLWLVSEADRNLVVRLADLLVMKTQIAVKLGKIEGFARAVGSETVSMFKLNPDISLHEFGIFLEDAPTQAERQDLFNQMSQYDQQGILEPQDRIMIEYCRNLKYAQMLLSYLVSKRKQQAQQTSLQLQQANGQTQIQSAQAAEQEKRQTLVLENQLALNLANTNGRWLYETTALKSEGSKTETQISAQAKIIQQQIIEENKQKERDSKATA